MKTYFVVGFAILLGSFATAQGASDPTEKINLILADAVKLRDNLCIEIVFNGIDANKGKIESAEAQMYSLQKRIFNECSQIAIGDYRTKANASFPESAAAACHNVKEFFSRKVELMISHLTANPVSSYEQALVLKRCLVEVIDQRQSLD